MEIRRKGIPGERSGEVLKRNVSGGAEYLTFPALERTGIVRHFFSTRLGGVSEGMFSTMNFSYTRGDRKEAVDENFRRAAQIMECGIGDFVCADQTHTTNVRKVTGADRGKGVTVQKDYRNVDGLVTNEAGVVLATFYADCVPLFLVDVKKRAIGLSHSGWRGTVGRMGACTLAAMKEAYGTDPMDVAAAVGPSICKDCYEVSGDVAEQFAEEFSGKVLDEILVPVGGDKFLLDLWKANFYVFTEAGVPEDRIQVTDICTCCNPDYLFSHRASQGKRGNLGAFLALRGEQP